MKLFFPHYKELSTQQKLKARHFEIVRALMLEKLISINNNPNLTNDMLKEHLHLEENKTAFYANEKTKDFIEITFTFNLFELFDCCFDLKIYVHYDETGRQTHYTPHYKEDKTKHIDTKLSNHLNINHFKNDGMKLEFYILDVDSDTSYSLIKDHCFRTPEVSNNIKNKTYFINSMDYFFDKDHRICRKTFETKKFGNECGIKYYLNEYGQPEYELLLIKFVNHIYNVKEDIDDSFLNYESVNFEDTHWFKVVNKSFYDNLNGQNRIAFLDYLKLIEMLEI